MNKKTRRVRRPSGSEKLNAARFELTTSASGGQRSIQLSYASMITEDRRSE